jgi:hypothetical protein
MPTHPRAFSKANALWISIKVGYWVASWAFNQVRELKHMSSQVPLGTLAAAEVAFLYMLPIP